MKVLIKGGLFGGLVAFIWMNISWMVLPWHMMTIDTVENDTQIAHTLKANISQDGLYILPWTDDHSKENMEAFNQRMESGPFVYMVVRPNGIKVNMGTMMLYGLIYNIVIAFMITYLLTKTSGLSYIQKVGFVKMVAITGALVIVVPNLIWWHFPIGYSLVTLIDTGFTWGFAGLAIGKIVKDN